MLIDTLRRLAGMRSRGATPGSASAEPRSRPAAPGPGGTPSRAARSVFVLRHAEAAPGERDPPLSEAGRARAAAVARLLEGAGVTHAFASDCRRARETAEPVARRAGVEVARRPGADVTGLVRAVHALPESSLAVVVGHADTVPLLVRAFGGRVPGEPTGAPPRHLPHDEHSRAFLIVLASGEDEKPAAVLSLELRVHA